jgi:hypothetical protein
VEKENLRTEINGKYNDMSSAGENNKMSTIEPLCKNYKKTIQVILVL